MPTIYYTIGLPGSGKTTLARQMVRQRDTAYEPKLIRVNRDELRAMLHDSAFSNENEKCVTQVQDLIVNQALEKGMDVILDNTNLNPRTIRQIEAIANRHNADIVPIDLTYVAVEECIRRDAKRDRTVGEKVIRGMFERYLQGTAEHPHQHESTKQTRNLRNLQKQ